MTAFFLTNIGMIVLVRSGMANGVETIDSFLYTSTWPGSGNNNAFKSITTSITMIFSGK